MVRRRKLRSAQVTAKFVIKKGTTGKFRFALHAANGEIIATSEHYNSKQSCKAGIEAVKKQAARAAVEDQTLARAAAR
jgi:uncharacterized protein YegP (UPF0339 family)